MSIDSFIPKLWTARLLTNLQKNLVFANLLNRNYEGEIKQKGDTVHINSLNDITVKTYTKNTNIEDAELLTTTSQELKINQADYFNIAIDDVDKIQAAADLMDTAMANASYQLSNKVDNYIANLLKSGEIVKDLGDDGTPIVITKENAYEILVKIRTALDKSNVPKQGRWIVLPPEFEGFMLLDPRFAYNISKSESRLENGAISRAAGFDIYISNNVPNETDKKYKIIASHREAATFANQLSKTEAYRPEKRFSDAIKGLHLYGAKVTKPKEVAIATVNFTAEE